MELRDGSIRKVYELPGDFPTTLPACAHGIAEDGGWHLYVAAITDAPVPHLIVWRFLYTWPTSNESLALLNVPLASLNMGSAIPPSLSVAVTNFTLWVSLERGLIGLNLGTGEPSRRLEVGAGSHLIGLQYEMSGDPRRVVGLLIAESGASSIASFIDSGSGLPALSTRRTSAPVAPSQQSWAAILSDQGAYAAIDKTRLVTLDIDSGAVRANASACDATSCPIAVAYEPFVF